MASNGNEQVIEGEAVQTAIVPTPEPQTLGPIGVRDPHAMVREASEMAKALADIINSQKLFAIIQGKKYVLCEGWTTLGAMLGIVTVEEDVKEISNGFEARVRLIAARDGRLVGGASAICTSDEPAWKSRSPYALRSMALTRATSKAFRLAYAWIMKLAGYEATPAEEMIGTEKQQDWEEGAKAAKAVLDRKVAEAKSSVHTEGASVKVEGASLALKVVTFTSNEIMREWKGRPHPWQQLVGPVDEIADNLKDQDPHFLSEFMWRDDEYGVWYVFRSKADILAEIVVSMGMDAKRGSSPKADAPATPSSTKASSPKTESAPSTTSGTARRAILAEGHLAGTLDEAKVQKLKQKAGSYLKVKVGEYEASLFDNVELNLDGRKVRAFVELPNSLHQPVEFLVKPNGQYLNVVRILRLGCFEFDETDGTPIIRREPATSQLADGDLGI